MNFDGSGMIIIHEKVLAPLRSLSMNQIILKVSVCDSKTNFVVKL